MKAPVVDEFSRDLGQVSTRRGLVRLLGGVAALGAVTMVGRGEADAKKKPKKKKKKTCKRGTQVAQLAVPYNGVPVLTPVLKQGQTYTVQVSGAAATNATHSVDAEYDFITADPNNPATVTDIAVGWDVGLSIDDATPADMTKPTRWGPYNPTHVYTQQIIGQGRAASLLMLDSIYTDNSGAVSVTITCG